MPGLVEVAPDACRGVAQADLAGAGLNGFSAQPGTLPTFAAQAGPALSAELPCLAMHAGRTPELSQECSLAAPGPVVAACGTAAKAEPRLVPPASARAVSPPRLAGLPERRKVMAGLAELSLDVCGGAAPAEPVAAGPHSFMGQACALPPLAFAPAAEPAEPAPPAAEVERLAPLSWPAPVRLTGGWWPIHPWPRLAGHGAVPLQTALHLRPDPPEDAPAALEPAQQPPPAAAAPRPTGRLHRWWASASRIWASAPNDLKWIGVAIPVILALVIYSRNPGHWNASAVAREQSGAVSQQLGGRVSAVKRAVMRRAAIQLGDDFRSGLGAWSGNEGWAGTWKYDSSGGIAPGQLALYSPSRQMADYTLEFVGQIERRSLNWVVRARDTKNYYAMRLVILKPGPLPVVHLERYAVVNGREGPPTSLPLPLTSLRQDTLFKVSTEASGRDFVTRVQGQVVDSFSDNRLAQGGIGFFSPRGDRSLLRYVEVTYQQDFLGRLCALLAPYNVPAGVRSTE
jgi:hypothetical protein